MNSLLARLVALCILVAILATSVSAWVAAHAVVGALAEQERNAAVAAGELLNGEIDELLASLSFEVGDYASWDELYDHVPAMDAEWARINLKPGGTEGRLSQVSVVIVAGAVSGRFDFHGPRGPEAIPADPADPADLARLCVANGDARGLAWLNGKPVLWACGPIVHSDGSGPARGMLLHIAYLTTQVHERLTPQGWTWRIIPPGEVPDAVPEGILRGDVILHAVDAPHLQAVVERPREIETELRFRTVRAIVVAGFAVAALAALVGVLLALHWLRPLRQLAAACHRRARDADTVIPDGGVLEESRVLAAELRSLVETEKAARGRIVAELAHVEATDAQRRRLLARIGEDLGRPAHAVAGLVGRLRERGGLLSPEDASRLGVAADELLWRLQDAAGAGEGSLPVREQGGKVDMAVYAAGVVDLLREVATQRGTAIRSEASGEVALDASRLTPVLVNLLANAVRASPRDSTVTLRGGNGAGIWWEVVDQGGGIPAAQAVSIAAACARGQVVPGEPGIGFGLAQAIANVARMGGRMTLVGSGPEGTRFRIELPVELSVDQTPISTPISTTRTG